MKMKSICKLLVWIPLLTACDDLFEPAKENNRGLDAMYAEPAYAEGLLGYAYGNMPLDTKSVTDVATDDAVTNDRTSSYYKMTQGQWSAQENPISKWQSCRASIQYINIFLQNVDKVKWVMNEAVNQMYIDRLTGEGYALRALNNYFLLQQHAGVGAASGQLMGIPMLTEPETAESDFNQPRLPFGECIKMVMDDLDKAIQLLPVDYKEHTDSEIPQKYQSLGVTNASDYNRVNGQYMSGRISGRIAEAIKAQVALMAASPAYTNDAVTWTDAAAAAATVLNRIGGVSGMSKTGYRWFMEKDEIDKRVQSGLCPAEIIWRGDRTNGTEDWNIGLNQEKDNYPPTLYGKGRINPTQNLVDAFPMANGYPIDMAAGNYDSSKPYENRDPRFYEYILYNGVQYHGATIETLASGSTNDAMNKQSTSTRTGYYLRKLLRDDCNAEPGKENGQYHYHARIRYTEIFLAYAEAANEAQGPQAKVGGANFSAYDVIKALKERAGAGTEYLESVKGDQAKMRELIRNERRIELCFENKRFWDLRRWKSDLTEAAKDVTGKVVDARAYGPHQIYGPLPYSEVLKWSNLEQNQGW